MSDGNEIIQVLFHMIIKYECVYFTTSIKDVMLFVRNCGGGRNICKEKGRLINYQFSNYMCEIQ